MQQGERSLLRVLLPAIVFCLSFTAVFVALGMTATGLGSTLQDSRGTLDKIAGVVIIALGVLFLLTPFVPQLNREWRPDALIVARRLGRPADRRRGVRVRLDAVRRPDARRDPHRRRRRRTRVGEGAILLALLLARAGRPVPAHRARVHARDGRVPLAARPLPDHHRGLRRRADRDGRPAAHRRADAAQHRGPAGARLASG